MYKKRIVLFNICILLIFSFTFADNNGDKNHFCYKLPLYKDSLMNSIWINAQYSNPSITIVSYMLGSSTNQYGGAIGYAQTINNFIKWGVGLGILYGAHEYSSGINEYNKSISLQLPITLSVGKKGYDYFAFKIGTKVTPFITIQTEEFSDEFSESGTGRNYELLIMILYLVFILQFYLSLCGITKNSLQPLLLPFFLQDFFIFMVRDLVLDLQSQLTLHLISF